jgi:hypothetical protein
MRMRIRIQMRMRIPIRMRMRIPIRMRMIVWSSMCVVSGPEILWIPISVDPPGVHGIFEFVRRVEAIVLGYVTNDNKFSQQNIYLDTNETYCDRLTAFTRQFGQSFYLGHGRFIFDGTRITSGPCAVTHVDRSATIVVNCGRTFFFK